uniref:Uncharacterized protein n=1 Tax=Anguilla anguilla TaxID=7936 RepID=A0A0E9TN93_ANGAN
MKSGKPEIRGSQYHLDFN